MEPVFCSEAQIYLETVSRVSTRFLLEIDIFQRFNITIVVLIDSQNSSRNKLGVPNRSGIAPVGERLTWAMAAGSLLTLAGVAVIVLWRPAPVPVKMES